MGRKGGRSSFILKRDVKDAFRNIPLASHIRWLFGFSWEDNMYVEKCLSFGLCTAPYLFNLFAEALHWMMVSYLHWTLVCHYLDDFIYIIPASEVSSQRLHLDIKAYNELMALLGMPNNGAKEEQGTVVIVFGIEIDTVNLIARLPQDKLEKVRDATSAALASKSGVFYASERLTQHHRVQRFHRKLLTKVSSEISHKGFVGNLIPIRMRLVKGLHLSTASLLQRELTCSL